MQKILSKNNDRISFKMSFSDMKDINENFNPDGVRHLWPFLACLNSADNLHPLFKNSI